MCLRGRGSITAVCVASEATAHLLASTGGSCARPRGPRRPLPRPSPAGPWAAQTAAPAAARPRLPALARLYPDRRAPPRRPSAPRPCWGPAVRPRARGAPPPGRPAPARLCLRRPWAPYSREPDRCPSSPATWALPATGRGGAAGARRCRRSCWAGGWRRSPRPRAWRARRRGLGRRTPRLPRLQRLGRAAGLAGKAQ
jgi:hypothetical protein